MKANLVGTTYVNTRFKNLAICRYEYRGHEYSVEYDKINIKPSHIYAQDHRSEQNRIDNIINQDIHPKTKTENLGQSLEAWLEEVGDI